MVVLKYEKTGTAAYLPHLDTLRALQRAFRRAEIPVEYSKGFNPHMLMFLSQPLPLGLPSLAEYAAVHTDEEPDAVLERYNRFAVPGLRASKCARTEKNPNVAGNAVAADYIFRLPEGNAGAALDILSKDLTLEYVRNGKHVVDNLSGKLLEASGEGGEIRVRGGLSNQNLRADRLARHIETVLGLPPSSISCLRTVLLYNCNGTLSNIDELLGMC